MVGRLGTAGVAKRVGVPHRRKPRRSGHAACEGRAGEEIGAPFAGAAWDSRTRQAGGGRRETSRPDGDARGEWLDHRAPGPSRSPIPVFSSTYKLCLWNCASCATSSRSPTSVISRARRRASTSPSPRSPSRSSAWRPRSGWRSSSARRARSRSPAPASCSSRAPATSSPSSTPRSAELQTLAGVQGGRLSVGALHTMGPVDLSLLLASFHRNHPAVELTVREQSSEELAEMLRDDVIDLAFLSVTERIQSRGLELHPLVSEELVAVLPMASIRSPAATACASTELAGEPVHQLPHRLAAARAAGLRRRRAPASSRGSRWSPTRAGGSAASSPAASASRSCRARTPPAPGAPVAIEPAHRARAEARRLARLARRAGATRPPRPPSSRSRGASSRSGGRPAMIEP